MGSFRLGPGQGGVREIRGHLQGLWKYVGQKIDTFFVCSCNTSAADKNKNGGFCRSEFSPAHTHGITHHCFVWLFLTLDGGFKYFVFSPLVGEMIQFD